MLVTSASLITVLLVRLVSAVAIVHAPGIYFDRWHHLYYGLILLVLTVIFKRFSRRFRLVLLGIALGLIADGGAMVRDFFIGPPSDPIAAYWSPAYILPMLFGITILALWENSRPGRTPDPTTALKNFESHNKKFFTWLAGRYDSGFVKNIFFSKTYHTIEGLVAPLLPRANQFLDVACGTGEIINRLARQFPNTTFVGIDFTPAMIAKAQEKNAALKNVQLTEASATNLPLQDHAFDIVLCSDAFHHFAEPIQVLAEVHRILKPNGKFLLVELAYDKLTDKLLFNPLLKHLEHGQAYYSKTRLTTLLSTNGFSILASQHHYFNNYYLCTPTR